MNEKFPITVILAVKNEALNIARCLEALVPAEKILVVDSNSTDQTAMIASSLGATVVQFTYAGGYPKKRQWALSNLNISTPWILLLDADEVVPETLWAEIRTAIREPGEVKGFLITKGFHFLGRRFKFGGFSHSAVLLFRKDAARFERLVDNSHTSLDMEVHERLVVDGPVDALHTALIHEDFKGLTAYIDRHNRYSTWEAELRFQFLKSGNWGADTIKPRLFGNAQERRRFLKAFAIKMPFEPQLWFLYHYFFRLGILEGTPGLIASQIRSSYIAQARAKLYELWTAKESHCKKP